MLTDFLAFMRPGPMELLIVWWFVLVFLVVPVALVVLVAVYMSKSSKERRKLQVKMDELTEQLRKTQEQLKARRRRTSDKSR